MSSLIGVVTGSYGTGGCVFCAPPTPGTVVTIIEGTGARVILCPAHHNALRAVLNKLGDQREI